MNLLFLAAAVGIVGLSGSSTVHGGKIVVRELVGAVFATESGNASGDPLHSGAVLEHPRFIRTGPDSRIQLELGEAVVRLGGDSAVQLRAEGLYLQQGSAVYARVGDDTPLTVELADASVLITGETGFVHVQRAEGRPLLLAGAISGRSTVRMGSRTVDLRSGELAALSPDGVSPIRSFDLPGHVQTAPLLNGFQTELPTADRIRSAERGFRRLERRGFVSSLADSRHPASAAAREFGKNGASSVDNSRIVRADSGAGLVALTDDIGVFGFQSRLNTFSHLTTTILPARLTIKKCTPPPAPQGDSGGRKFHKFKEKKKDKAP